MTGSAHEDRHRAVSYAACAWAALFGTPHLWWALGVRILLGGVAWMYLGIQGKGRVGMERAQNVGV